MVQHTNGNTRWATKQKYECVIRTHGTTYKWKYKMSDSTKVWMCYKDTWYNIQMEIQDERLNKSMNVL